jgi:hypothetical protein
MDSLLSSVQPTSELLSEDQDINRFDVLPTDSRILSSDFHVIRYFLTILTFSIFFYHVFFLFSFFKSIGGFKSIEPSIYF